METFARFAAICAFLLAILLQVANCDAEWPACNDTITQSCIKIVTVQPDASVTTVTTFSTYTPPLPTLKPFSTVVTETRPTLTTIWTLTAPPGNYHPIIVTVLQIYTYADETTTWTSAYVESDFSEWDATRTKPMSIVDNHSTSMPTSQSAQSSTSSLNALDVLQQALATRVGVGRVWLRALLLGYHSGIFAFCLMRFSSKISKSMQSKARLHIPFN
ncbi:uncharacterized protein MYCFIDRAFT_196155 [Pseudocercospora fijiensis CIRAD86]|uniref:Uncharacterized protein n=1 Tax=Pseudocercospora fijiensis (strain CIRAD86) TaxID=383855 RepID=M3AZP4_PSEFD|nr:uncharacterized protein MYCFIDRAFT_196155 [Pseudocercospora fijiensis CIRAD86]EME82643.1 hypothetical protein MYCFIDRAFT_196155 [Pseudocercospora fijiensis CIRAD86]